MTLPELPLEPPEYSPAPLCCCLCHRPVAEALELHMGAVCRRCLCQAAAHDTMDDLAALLCAPVLSESTE